MTWQTMDNAPKTGERILISCAYNKTAIVAAWNQPANGWVECPSIDDETHSPTHWQPLPKTIEA